MTCFGLLGGHHQVLQSSKRLNGPANHHPDPSPPTSTTTEPKGDDPRPEYHIQTHVHRLTCSHAVYVSYIIYRPDDEISTSATLKQYLVS